MIEHYRILVVEDDDLIRRGICDSLTVEGYEVIQTGDGARAVDFVTSTEFDLALLDVVVPHADGWEILSKIKQERPSTPVIMLTAKGSEKERVRGLKSGADDYLVKPFSLLELLARIEAVLRRSPDRPQYEPVLALPHGKLDLKNWVILFPDGRQEHLTVKEHGLIRHLAAHPDRTITRDEILARVWKMDPKLVDTRSVEVTMNRLREKLGPENADAIQTLRGRGYMWHEG